MEQQNTGQQPIVWNNYWISNECLIAENINATEYTLILGCTLCSIRIKNDKLIEMYFYDRTDNNQILAIEEHSHNTYTQINGIITRDDGAIYEYTDTGLVRVNDNRIYTTSYCNPKDLPSIVYTAYYFMYNSEALMEYQKTYLYNIKLLNVAKLQELMKTINSYHLMDHAEYVKNNLIIKEY